METDSEELMKSIDSYKQQLTQVQNAIESTTDQQSLQELLSLQNDIRQVIELTQQNLDKLRGATCSNVINKDDEYALFLLEMEKEGALKKSPPNENSQQEIESELKSLEGTKCTAPYKQRNRETTHHNAMICSVISTDANQRFEDIHVKVMFTNPVCKEMMPCPYLLNGDCKFEDDRCKYSHGEIVPFSNLKEYIEPNFEALVIDSQVLAKRSNNLWSEGVIKKIKEGRMFVVRFESDRECADVEIQDLLPVNFAEGKRNDESSDDDEEMREEDVINLSLLTPSNRALGDWEKYTKGVGSKIMQKMGYIFGTGLGRQCEGRVEPVTAVCLPPGKSLDHCMKLKEYMGGDKDFFSAEKKLRKLEKKQEERNARNYEREKNKVDVFNFLNQTLGSVDNAVSSEANSSKNDHRKEIKKETSRNLNVASLRIDETIKQVERDICKIKESMGRQSSVDSLAYKNLRQTLNKKIEQLNSSKKKALDISNELKNRNDKKKLTVF